MPREVVAHALQQLRRVEQLHVLLGLGQVRVVVGESRSVAHGHLAPAVAGGGEDLVGCVGAVQPDRVRRLVARQQRGVDARSQLLETDNVGPAHRGRLLLRLLAGAGEAHAHPVPAGRRRGREIGRGERTQWHGRPGPHQHRHGGLAHRRLEQLGERDDGLAGRVAAQGRVRQQVAQRENLLPEQAREQQPARERAAEEPRDAVDALHPVENVGGLQNAAELAEKAGEVVHDARVVVVELVARVVQQAGQLPFQAPGLSAPLDGATFPLDSRKSWAAPLGVRVKRVQLLACVVQLSARAGQLAARGGKLLGSALGSLLQRLVLVLQRLGLVEQLLVAAAEPGIVVLALVERQFGALEAEAQRCSRRARLAALDAHRHRLRVAGGGHGVARGGSAGVGSALELQVGLQARLAVAQLRSCSKALSASRRRARAARRLAPSSPS